MAGAWSQRPPLGLPAPAPPTARGGTAAADAPCGAAIGPLAKGVKTGYFSGVFLMYLLLMIDVLQ